MWRTENVANYLLKGKQIYLEGRIESRSYDDKEGQKRYITEIVCEGANAILLSSGRGDVAEPGAAEFDRPVSAPRSSQRPASPAPQPAPAEDFHQGITDDDVPF